MRAFRRARILILLALAAPFFAFCNLPGGENPCVLDQRCADNVAFSCAEECAEGCRWTSYAEDCAASGRVCLEQGDRHAPFCSLSKDPDPRCSAQTTFCDGDRIMTCSFGYVVDAKDCSKEGLTCASPPGESPICARSSEPDARCMGGTSVHCDGRMFLICHDGFVASETPCEHACVEPTPGTAFCALSAVKDPGCTPETIAYCAGNSEIFCNHEYLIDSWDCPVCALTALDAACFGFDGQEIQIKPRGHGQDGG